MASGGDIVVLQADDIQQVIQDVQDYKTMLTNRILLEKERNKDRLKKTQQAS